MSNITNNPFFFFSFFKFTDCSITSLVYCMRTENVVSVMCNGQWVMKNKKILTVDEVLLSLSPLLNFPIWCALEVEFGLAMYEWEIMR